MFLSSSLFVSLEKNLLAFLFIFRVIFKKRFVQYIWRWNLVGVFPDKLEHLIYYFIQFDLLKFTED